VLYAHFGDKDELFNAVHARRIEDFRSALRRAGRGGTSPLDNLERRGRAYVRCALAKRDAYQALFMTPKAMPQGTFADPEARRLTAYDDLHDNIVACMADGSIPRRDSELAARMVWCQIHGLASLLITMPEVTDGIGQRRLVDAVLAGITASLSSGDYA
jgi:AcrR family transcriptional regulator